MAKYAALEDKYRRSRGQGKEKLSDYKEKTGAKLTELHDCLKSMRADISNKHVGCNNKFTISFLLITATVGRQLW